MKPGDVIVIVKPPGAAVYDAPYGELNQWLGWIGTVTVTPPSWNENPTGRQCIRVRVEYDKLDLNAHTEYIAIEPECCEVIGHEIG